MLEIGTDAKILACLSLSEPVLSLNVILLLFARLESRSDK